MPTTTLLRRALLDCGVFGSLLLHVLLGVALWASRVPPAVDPPAERIIDVQIVAEPRSARPVAPSLALPSSLPEPQRPPVAPSLAQGEPAPAAREPQPSPRRVPEMVTGKTMLSTRILAGPHGHDARIFLHRLTGDARIEQLCGIEAMAQIGAWNRAFQPDRLVAYAMADPEMTGRAFMADGAAFHSRGQWFKVTFRCGLAPDKGRVVSLDFSVGAAIPKAEWPAYNLPSEDGNGD